MRTGLLFLAVLLLSSTHVLGDNVIVKDILQGEHRQQSAKRDRYRHPAETLAFFNVEPDMTVVEIWPGGQGWYTEILAPYLKNGGKLYAAHFNKDSPSEYYRRSRQSFIDKLSARPDLYANVSVTHFNPPEHVDIAPQGSADRVLTFRNVHNWYMRGGGDDRVLSAFKAFYRALKPGGVLGVVEHRLPVELPLSKQQDSGYMHEAYVIRLAEAAGFELVDSSDINSNPKDTADYPQGVWTLPPSLRAGDREHYENIGESDRMTLKFVKPKQSQGNGQ